MLCIVTSWRLEIIFAFTLPIFLYRKQIREFVDDSPPSRAHVDAKQVLSFCPVLFSSALPFHRVRHVWTKRQVLWFIQ